MPVNYEYTPYCICSYLLDSEGVKCRAYIVQCYRGCRLKYRIGASPKLHSCSLQNNLLPWQRNFIIQAHFYLLSQQELNAPYMLQGFTPQFKVVTRYCIGLRRTQNFQLRSCDIMDNIWGLSFFSNSRKELYFHSASCKAVWTVWWMHISNISQTTRPGNCRGLEREVKLATCYALNTSDLRVITILDYILMQLYG